MGLETGDYISDLNSANPDGATDQKSEGDNHLRLIKHILKTTFPNLNGAMTATQNALNGVPDAGVKMLFQQTAAPTGWTKDTTHNDKALRIVSGTVSSGGAKAFTTTFGVGKTTDSHTLIEAEVPAHTHGASGSHGHTLKGVTATGGAATYPYTAVGGSPSNISFGSAISGGAHTHTSFGGGGGHTHALTNFDLQYVDVIIATKD